MKFREKGWENKNIYYYNEKNLEIARAYAKSVYQEFGEFIKAIIIFGSLTKNTQNPESDVDILCIIDDVTIDLTSEVLDSFQIINEKIILNTSQKLHVHTISLTSYWEFIRSGDPVMMNILRDGVALIDTGFITPIQRMLFQGRIRPSMEAVYNYVGMAPKALFNAHMKLLQAVVDLYWAAMDITHAYLMKEGEMPVSPDHLPELMRKYAVFKKEDITLVQQLYTLTKDILQRRKNVIRGIEYDLLKKKVEKYYEKLRNKIDI